MLFTAKPPVSCCFVRSGATEFWVACQLFYSIISKVVFARIASFIWFKGTAARRAVDVQHPDSLHLPKLYICRDSDVVTDVDVINFLTDASANEG